MIAFIKHIFKLQFLLIIVAILAGVYYPEILNILKTYILPFGSDKIEVHYESAEKLKDIKLFTKAELAKFNGENETPIYLSLLGRVYDVSKGSKHYGPGCSYSYFAGRDASVSFITGEFETFVEEEADDVLTLKPSELLSLANWQKFYDSDYVYKGKLIGRFYDDNGEPTKYYHKYLALLEQAQDAKAAGEELRLKYPDCNIEWSKEKGSHVWCTLNSGGKERDWVGYPRKLFQVGSDNFRCACLRKEDLDTTEVMVKPYDNCDTFAHECYYHVD
ncbi:neuferricin homolog [Lucilia cuprina]|uniref:neuferricin homolog n=1 Tax=Lucilia cuprina TaxID=7375 RepID=UPI001F05E4D3|nr:neuferricin homolog [Lucilia cuprina]